MKSRPRLPATLLAEAVALARTCGYHVREEWLDGAGGGHCTFDGKKWLLLDATQPADEQLCDVVDALRCEAGVDQRLVSPSLAELLHRSKAA